MCRNYAASAVSTGSNSVSVMYMFMTVCCDVYLDTDESLQYTSD